MGFAALRPLSVVRAAVMAPKAMSKGALAEKVAGDAGLKRAQAVKILDNIAAIGTTEKKKAATKAGKRVMFGQEVVVKAKPAKTVVKAFPAAVLKKSVCRAPGLRCVGDRLALPW